MWRELADFNAAAIIGNRARHGFRNHLSKITNCSHAGTDAKHVRGSGVARPPPALPCQRHIESDPGHGSPAHLDG